MLKNESRLFDLFDHVYVLNLKHSLQRKKHITGEFKRVGLERYEFFPAVDQAAQQVVNMYASGRVAKYPPCFRCGGTVCNHNNILIPQQVANWCSFTNIMKDIVEQDRSFVMICEDDIKFTDRHSPALKALGDSYYLQKYKIDFDKPLLIRLGSAWGFYHKINFKPRLLKKIHMSNPCFAVNKAYAATFLNNLDRITHTSDEFMHKLILKKDPTIQHFFMIPQIVFDLSSSGPYQQFESEIRASHVKLSVQTEEEYLQLLQSWQEARGTSRNV